MDGFNQDGWDDWSWDDNSEGTQEIQVSQDTEWGEWGNTQTQTTDMQDTSNWNDDWSSFESGGATQSTFEQPVQEQDYWEQENQKYEEENQTLQSPKKEFNFGGIAVMFIILGVLFVLFLIFIGLARVKVTPKNKTQNTTAQVSVATNTGQQTSTKQTSNAVSLTIVDDSIATESGNAVLSAAGVVTAKERYLQGSQLIYCINIGISESGENKDIKYYCSQDVYNSVKNGDILMVNYTQVSNKCFAVVNVQK